MTYRYKVKMPRLSKELKDSVRAAKLEISLKAFIENNPKGITLGRIYVRFAKQLKSADLEIMMTRLLVSGEINFFLKRGRAFYYMSEDIVPKTSKQIAEVFPKEKTPDITNIMAGLVGNPEEKKEEV